jgi:prophage regulatory protein
MSHRVHAPRAAAPLKSPALTAPSASHKDPATPVGASGERVLRKPDVKRRTGLSNSTIHAWIREGRFPAPVALGARAVGWIESEIDAWIANRAAARRGAPSMIGHCAAGRGPTGTGSVGRALGTKARAAPAAPDRCATSQEDAP